MSTPEDDLAKIGKLLSSRLSRGIQSNKMLAAKQAQETQQMGEGKSFKSILSEYAEDVNALQHHADSEIEQMAEGKRELHDVMIAMDEAETSFEMMMQIRNKLVDAYKELSRMTQ